MTPERQKAIASIRTAHEVAYRLLEAKSDDDGCMCQVPNAHPPCDWCVGGGWAEESDVLDVLEALVESLQPFIKTK